MRLVARRALAALLDVEPLVGLAEAPMPSLACSGRRTAPNELVTANPSPCSQSASSESSSRRLATVASGRREQAELVAAEPIAAAVAGGCLGELAAEPGEQRVAGRVAEGVVVRP